MLWKNDQNISETCIVLAGGLGTRLHMVSNGKNKHACRIAGKIALQHTLEPIYATASVRRVAIVIQPGQESWVTGLLKVLQPDTDTRICIQSTPNGTLSAVQCALPVVNTEIFSVHYGDNIFGWMRLPELNQCRTQYHSAELYTTAMVGNSYELGVVESKIAGKNRLVSRILEKPKCLDGFQNPEILTGFFRFRMDSFLLSSKSVGVSVRGEYELTAIINKMLALSLRITARKVDVGWVDFGTPNNFRVAEKVLRERNPHRHRAQYNNYQDLQYR